MRLVVFQSVQILVALLANIAFVWLLLFHAHGTRVWSLGIGVDNRKCAVSILVESLIVMTVLYTR
jgi:hypothetical protein